MRACKQCPGEKPDECFETKVVRGKIYFRRVCRDCRNRVKRATRPPNVVPDHLRIRRRRGTGPGRFHNEKRPFVNEIKKGPCTDCHHSFEPCVMDFDHVRGVKVDNVGTMVSSKKYSLDEVKAEIEKCELVCANCHRLRTHRRRTKRQS